ncbi:MAG TPA: polymer-forming cytoskeletal protein [Anaerolineae bacterium]|nr:polymer-forming cytoskeletal protein [Anaerolineae bacterium]
MMKRKIFTLAVTLLLLIISATPILAQEPEKDSKDNQVVFGENYTLQAGQRHDGDLAVLGGNVTLESESTVEGDMFVFGGTLTIEPGSTVEGDLAVFGGNVDVDGTVKGDLGVVGGNASLSETAVVEGDIGTVGGNVSRAEGSRIEGDVQDLNRFQYDRGDDDDDDEAFESWDHRSEYREPSFFGWVGMVIGDVFWNVALIIVLGLIAWLVAAFLPDQMYTVRQTVTSSGLASLLTGLGTSVVALILVPVGILLMITICLAIVPILAYVALGIAALFGWIVIGQLVGERLIVASGRSQPSLVMSSIVGVAVLTIVANMPGISEFPFIGWLFGLVGFLVWLVAIWLGLGAVILTRFGTRSYPVTPSQPSSYGGGSYSGGGPGSSAYASPRVRWTEPPPDVSEEDAASSEAELRAKIKAALAEADQMKEAQEEAAQVRAETEPSLADLDAAEAELRAKIKAALAEADEIAEAKAKAEALRRREQPDDKPPVAPSS